MATPIRDTDPICGKQAEELEELLFRPIPGFGPLQIKRLDARLPPEAIEILRNMPSPEQMSTRFN